MFKHVLKVRDGMVENKMRKKEKPTPNPIDV
jgi:hypothetical protein